MAGIQADPEWFQLRQHTQNKQNSRFAGGAAQLGLAVVDTDCRRQLFGQRMLHMTGELLSVLCSLSKLHCAKVAMSMDMRQLTEIQHVDLTLEAGLFSI